jgi:hypothetical protein
MERGDNDDWWILGGVAGVFRELGDIGWRRV